MKIIYKIEEDEYGSSPDEIVAHCQKLSTLGLRTLTLDIKDAGQIDLFGVVSRISTYFDEIRFYCCAPENLYKSCIQETASFYTEYHVLLTEISHFIQHYQSFGFKRGRKALTLFLVPGDYWDCDALLDWLLEQEFSEFRFALYIPENPEKCFSLDSYKPVAEQMVNLVAKLASYRIRTGVFGPLPFCLFSESELGVLARECLPYSDYRKDYITLSINQRGSITPWDGPLRLLVTSLERRMSIQHIYNFYRVRRHEIAFRLDAFRECSTCTLKEKGLCSACHYYSPPQSQHEGLGFYPIERFPSLIPYLSCRIHSIVSVDKIDGSYILSIREDRTLSSLRLNSSAFILYELCSAHKDLSYVLEKISLLYGARHLKNFLALIDQVQKSGFLILKPSKTVPQDLEKALYNWTAATWRNL